jgi:fructose-specific phosphotransferase system IIC component
MDSKRALIIAGTAFILMAVLGFFDILGPGAKNSILGQTWWLDNTENGSHLIFGLIFLACSFLVAAPYRNKLAWAFGAVLVVLSVYSITTAHILHVNLEAPIEEVIYFTVGDIILWGATRDKKILNSNGQKDEIV